MSPPALLVGDGGGGGVRSAWQGSGGDGAR